ncbi:MAG: phage major capsid protein [Mycolicibacter algericus]|uniref:phage major capsid protein n=1 Tax=Mycolicibacter algericus TaxID=1288388 RepID=UPI003C790695
MSMKRTDQAQSWLPQAFGEMLDLEVQAKSVAAQASTLFGTEKQKVGFPLWVADPAVGWYGELDEISLTDGDTDEVVVTPTKTAGLTLVSNELADDSDPDVAEQIAAALANQIAHAIDKAFLGNTTAKGPNGLLSLTSTAVDSGAAVANLDAFVKARYAAEANGAKLSHWLMSSDTAEALSLLKRETGSNEPLIQFVEDGITVAGLPVVTSTHVDADTVAWGIDKSQQRYVLRKGTTVERFPAVTTDGLYIRAISRIGLGFLNPAGVVRIYDAA